MVWTIVVTVPELPLAGEVMEHMGKFLKNCHPGYPIKIRMVEGQEQKPEVKPEVKPDLKSSSNSAPPKEPLTESVMDRIRNMAPKTAKEYILEYLETNSMGSQGDLERHLVRFNFARSTAYVTLMRLVGERLIKKTPYGVYTLIEEDANANAK